MSPQKQLVPDTAQFRLIQRFAPAGDPTVDFMNVFYVRNTVAGFDGPHLAATAEDIANAWIAEMASQQTSDVLYIEVQAEDLANDPGEQAVHAMTGGGLVVPPSLPLSIAALIQLRGSTGADPRRGRIFMGGVPEAQNTANFLDETYRTATQTDIRSFYSTAMTPGDAFVLVSRFDESLRDPVTNPTGERPTGVTNLISPLLTTVRSLIGSQRDRRT